MNANTITQRRRIGEVLVERGLITQAQLDEVLTEQTLTGKRLGELVVEKGWISEDDLLHTVSERLGIPKISLRSLVIDPSVVRKVSVEIARRYTLIPIMEIGNTLTLAMVDPLNIIAIDEIRYHTGKNVKRAIAAPSEIRAAIDQYYSVGDSLTHLIADDRESATSIDVAPATTEDTESPIIKLVDLIIAKAVRERASDIHVEPEESRLRIRYRIDGVMREEAAPPKAMQSELLSRIKVAANLDVSEKRLPQDGRFMVRVENVSVDLRVSTLPTIHGEKIVIRLLDRRNTILRFSQLGFNSKTESAWKSVVNKPEGLVLISGPTSSGKTSTLYATLNEINSVEKNIITVEDPVEYSLPLVNQIQINERAGLTFPSTLRSILRQNPDVIMIGEIRDGETAQMAIRSSLTGHLVFSTIHTNDAPSTITRLVDMGVERYLVAAAVKGVLAQRLVRLNCSNCAEPYRPSDILLQRAGLTELVDVFSFKKGIGCPECRRTGFRGQTGIFEFIEVTPLISEMIVSGATIHQIKDEARLHGYLPLFETGLQKLTQGAICLEELLKETSHVEEFGTMTPHARMTYNGSSVPL